MVLIPATLAADLTSLFEDVAAGQIPTATLADRWAAAFASYMKTVSVPPTGAASPTHTAAEQAMAAILEGGFSGAPPTQLAALTSGLTAYMAIWAPGTVPWVTLPPPLPLPPPPPTPAPAPAAAATLAAFIHAWVITSLTVLPPATAPSPIS